jgi:hypothetical protein
VHLLAESYLNESNISWIQLEVSAMETKSSHSVIFVNPAKQNGGRKKLRSNLWNLHLHFASLIISAFTSGIITFSEAKSSGGGGDTQFPRYATRPFTVEDFR